MSIAFLAWAGFCLGFGFMLGSDDQPGRKGTQLVLSGLGMGLIVWALGLLLWLVWNASLS